jgi:hypothetical protein
MNYTEKPLGQRREGRGTNLPICPGIMFFCFMKGAFCLQVQGFCCGEGRNLKVVNY